jgi:hypothetical protein
MKADTLTLTQLFNHPISFVVPLYQRRYVWNRDAHWEPLWEDVRSTTEALLRERDALATTTDAALAEERTPPHFLGAIVVEQVPVGAGMIDVRNVIDGQQRLMTLQLFLDAAHDVAQDLGDEKARLFAMLTENDHDLVRTVGERHKVWPSKYDQDAFRLTMGRDEALDHQDYDPAGSPLWQAHEYFREVIRGWLTSDERSTGDKLDALRTTLWRLIRVVTIDLEGNDNAQVIFETLNARGTPLLASDLIRNTVFRQASEAGLQIDPLYERYWKVLDTEWWRDEISQGRLKRPRLDVFFFHWLTMRLDDEVGVHQVFPRFKRYSETSGPEALLADISLHAKTYKRFEEYRKHTIEGTFFDRLRAMEMSTATPLLLFVLAHNDDAVPSEQKHRLMQAIESWLVRRVICRMTTKRYNLVFLALQAAVQDEPEVAGDITVGFLRGLSGESQAWPTDEDVLASLLTVPMYKVMGQGRVRMLLEALENALRSGMADEASVGDRVSIEHILPQAWEANWLPPEGPDRFEAVERRDLLKHTIGNLTLVNGRLNAALSNAPWSEKHETLREHITLFLNKDVVNRYATTWGEEEIQERGRTLAELALGIWQGPASPIWPASAADSKRAREFMAQHEEDLAPSGADVGAEDENGEARSLSHTEIATTVRTDFLRDVLATFEPWLANEGITVKHMKGSHHSLYVERRWIGGYYFASKWLHVWLRGHFPADDVLSGLSRRPPSVKERSVVGNVANEDDLELLKQALRARAKGSRVGDADTGT